MKVRFTADFDWWPQGAPGTTIAYKEGMELTVTHECAAAAIAAGKAVSGEPPSSPSPARGEGNAHRKRD